MIDTSLTVMTANVGAGLAPLPVLEAAIRAADVDVVAMQELPRSQAVPLEDALADLYPYTAFIADRNEGRGLLSRFPIRESQEIEIAPGRPDVIATLAVVGCDLTVVIVHPRPQRVTRTGLLFTYSSLKQLLRQGQYTVNAAPAVLLGDLNMTPRHPGYRRLVRLGLRDTWAEAGRGGGSTFPTRIGHTRFSAERFAQRRVPPVVRFDYIWCTGEIAVEDAWVGPDTGSDHAPVVARLRLPVPG